MPRRQPHVVDGVPLWLIAPAIKQRVAIDGDELERIVVKRAAHHHFNISIHTRPVKRELQPRLVKELCTGTRRAA